MGRSERCLRVYCVAYYLQEPSTHLEASCTLFSELDCNMPVNVVMVETAACCVCSVWSDVSLRLVCNNFGLLPVFYSCRVLPNNCCSSAAHLIQRAINTSIASRLGVLNTATSLLFRSNRPKIHDACCAQQAH